MGRGSPIPPMLRRKIVEQYQKGVSQRKIAKSLKLSSSTVHNIIQRFRESGTIAVRKGQGRKTILDACDLRALRRHCITYRNATVMEITTWAQEYFQKTLSVNTIHHAIRRCRLKLYRSKKKPYLNMIQKRRRFLWAKAHLKWTVAKWKTVLWSDESKFEVLFGKLGCHVIRTKENKDNPSCYQRSVQKPASLMVWGCMSACGMGSLHIWKGTINAESTNFIPDRSRPGLTTTAIGAVDLQGAGGNWATVGRRSRGGRRVHRQREKRKGKGRELADVMERRKVDILCVQETKWKGSKARSIGAGFKLFYYGVDSKRNGVGVVLKEEFVRNVLEVGCELEEKERFWSELDEVMESIPTGERVVIGADFNGHVGEGNTGDEEVMGKFGVKERNLEGQMVVDFAKRMDMGVVNTYFQKREEHRVTYKSGGRRTQIEKKTKWWKLKKEECSEVIRETGRKVLGVSSGRRKEDKETWWWNEEVQDSIQRKRLAKKKWDMDRTEENRQEYKELQRRVKREVSKAKQKAYEELYTRLDTREGEKDLYRLARQRDRDGKDVQQVRVIKDRDGRVLTSEESVQRRWKEYFEELMNEENEREKRVEGVNSVEQKVDKIRKDEVRKALKRMKSGKAVGPDDIPVEVWKCLGEAAVEFLANLFNRVLENLEKAYDRVPREELWYCMRKSGVVEKYVRVVQDMYERSRTVVRCAVGQTEEFNVEVGLHQGSALSPFLFAIVMDQLSEEVRQESPWTMMFADDIVICSESREQVEENLERWRFALERRGMKVSRSKTEYMCVNEREGSGTVRLQGEEVKKVQEFKYLGSTVQSNGECGKEVKKRVQAGWNGWRKVSGVLCDQKISARIKGKVYRTVVRPAMLYGLETVSLRKRQESELEVAELKMLRFSLGVTRLDRIRNEYIRGTAHVGRLGDKVREARLRWFGHVQRRDNKDMDFAHDGAVDNTFRQFRGVSYTSSLLAYITIRLIRQMFLEYVRISRRSQGLEGVRFWDHRISSLIFADDVVLLSPSSLDLQHALGHFAAECVAAGMRVSTSKSEAMVLDRKKVACTLQVGGELLPQVEEFKYLRVLFTSEGRMDREIDRWIGAVAAVMRSMYRSVVVKKELSQKAKLSIYQSIYVPTLTYGRELWVMTERPANSPDLNPIENLWGIVKRKMRNKRPKNADELKATVKETWASIPPQQCHKLITSIPCRIEAVIKAKGAPTKY
ncbi:hypothetical protein QTP70_003054 [Hemibagrus guttatus]|uniref:ribonuclease H n=1 Tax=Hemibagrus guttatus TaxID=175788 RepID=A0AAE0R9M7_9TELE|nr:hypothetical protein QTP70_003054 [Hemibagrus guttatus]